MVAYLFPGVREPFCMTNRGLSIKLKVTPWSKEMYLAFFGCAEETARIRSETEWASFYNVLRRTTNR